MRQSNSEIRAFVMYFGGSLRGLSVGAPVDLRGITIGEVTSLSVEYERDAGTLRFPVEVDIFPQRIRGRSRHTDRPGIDAETASRELVDSLVAHGMRAELKTGSLLTGQKYVALDFHNEVKADHVGWSLIPPCFRPRRGRSTRSRTPSAASRRSSTRYLSTRCRRRLVATLQSLDDTLKSADRLLKQVDTSVAPEISATLQEAQGAMKNAKEVLAHDAPLQTDLSSTLLQLSRAAKSVTALVIISSGTPSRCSGANQETRIERQTASSSPCWSVPCRRHAPASATISIP